MIDVAILNGDKNLPCTANFQAHSEVVLRPRKESVILSLGRFDPKGEIYVETPTGAYVLGFDERAEGTYEVEVRDIEEQKLPRGMHIKHMQKLEPVKPVDRQAAIAQLIYRVSEAKENAVDELRPFLESGLDVIKAADTVFRGEAHARMLKEEIYVWKGKLLKKKESADIKALLEMIEAFLDFYLRVSHLDQVK